MDKSTMDPPPYPGPPGPPGFTVQQQGQPIFYQHSVQPVPYQHSAQAVSYQHSTQPQMQNVVVMQAQPTESPGQMKCPFCHNDVVTVINYKNGLLTWLICGAIGIFFCWPFCWIPFCIDACKDVEHSCPMCYNVINVHKRM